MSDNPYRTPAAELNGAASGEPAPGIVTTANVVYALHTLSLVVGIVGAATIVGSFLFSIPSIIAVIINYVKRSDARGSWVESHFRWQIRTFWYGVLWSVIAGLIFATLFWLLGLGILIAAIIFLVLGAWFIYRVARGWLRLRDKRPMYV